MKRYDDSEENDVFEVTNPDSLRNPNEPELDFTFSDSDEEDDIGDQFTLEIIESDHSTAVPDTILHARTIQLAPLHPVHPVVNSFDSIQIPLPSISCDEISLSKKGNQRKKRSCGFCKRSSEFCKGHNNRENCKEYQKFKQSNSQLTFQNGPYQSDISQFQSSARFSPYSYPGIPNLITAPTFPVHSQPYYNIINI